MPPPTMDEPKAKTAIRRLSFILSESAYDELQELAHKSHRSMTELVRFGIGLMRVAEDAKKQKLKLMVVNEKNEAIREIVLPG